jgi:hypothetical protein
MVLSFTFDGGQWGDLAFDFFIKEEDERFEVLKKVVPLFPLFVGLIL